MTEHLARIALNCVPNVGAVKVRTLINTFGTLSAVARTTPLEIEQTCCGISLELAQNIIQALNSSLGQEEVDKASTCNVTILTELDSAWPKAFADLSSPPLCLYCVGDVSLLNEPQIAIVGTRNPTLYGKDQAKRIANYLASIGLHVTSGLAFGIDTAAHRGALDVDTSANGKTIAVIGAGLDELYPQGNRPLAREIVQKKGLVISEYPFGRHADTKTFPQRNRIIVALANAILVTETANRGGTMNTVAHAQALKRPIFAIPGRIGWPSFQGNHKLIREGVAKLITHGEHIISDIKSQCACHTNINETPMADDEITSTQEATKRPLGLTQEEALVWQAADLDGSSLDDLSEQTGLPINQLLAITTCLQMRKKLRALPGGLIARIAE